MCLLSSSEPSPPNQFVNAPTRAVTVDIRWARRSVLDHHASPGNCPRKPRQTAAEYAGSTCTWLHPDVCQRALETNQRALSRLLPSGRPQAFCACVTVGLVGGYAHTFHRTVFVRESAGANEKTAKRHKRL